MSMIEKQIEKWEEIHRRSFLTFANTGNEQLDEAYQVIARLVDEATKMTKYLSAKLSASNLNGGWHIVEEGDFPPIEKCGCSDYVLVSFDNFYNADIARYEENEDGGAFYPGDDDKSYLSYGLFVNAWMPLPVPYKKEVE